MLKQLFFKFLQRLRYDNIIGYAAQISFFLLVSLIPFLVLLMAALSRFEVVSLPYIVESLKELEIFPDAFFNLIESSVIGVTMPSSTIPFYIFVVLWFASRGIRSIMNGIQMTYRTSETKNLLKHFAVSFLFTIAFILLLIIFMVFIIYGDALSAYLSELLDWPIVIESIIFVLRYTIPLFFLFITYTTLYRVVPDKNLKTREVLPGSISASLATMLISRLFSKMTMTATSYSALYGGIAGVVTTCTWMYIFSTILVLGSELNACLYEIKNNTTLISIH